MIDNLLVRMDLIIDMIWWTGLAPWESEFPFPGSLVFPFLIHLAGMRLTRYAIVDIIVATANNVKRAKLAISLRAWEYDSEQLAGPFLCV